MNKTIHSIINMKKKYRIRSIPILVIHFRMNRAPTAIEIRIGTHIAIDAYLIKEELTSELLHNREIENGIPEHVFES